MKRDIRIALVTCPSLVGDTKGNLLRMEKWTASARQKGAELLCFPELSATGYHVREEIQNKAETIPGTSSEHIAEMAQKHGICILAGIAEKKDGNIYAAHVLAKPESGITGIYRKLHLGPPEKKIFTPGLQPPCLFETRDLRIGIQLCYDAHFPELSTSMALKGADIIFIPHASPGKSADEKLASWMRHLPARAFDNGLYVAAVNAAGKNGCGLSFPGAAVLLSPEGKILYKYTGSHETMVCADLSVKTIESVRQHPMKYFLPNRRPEVYV
ncbi:MAG: nitrilase [Desulfobacteraceae bacterium]|nr:nitrilase [Desulfobacteraceae bacterium]